MNSQKFSCPHCQQHIECDEAYAGATINCPTCQGALVVPANPAAPASSSPSTGEPVAPSGAVKLRATEPSKAPPGQAIGTGDFRHRRPASSRAARLSAGNRMLNALLSVAVLAALVIGLVLGVPALSRQWRQVQQKSDNPPTANTSPRGELGELDTVMDAGGELDSASGAGGSGGAATVTGGTLTNQRPAAAMQPQPAVRSGTANPRPAPLTIKQRARQAGQN